MRTAPTRRPLAVLVALALLATALVAALARPAPAGALPPDVADSPEAWHAARWLASQVTEAGFIPDPNGDPVAANTVQTGLALAAAGIQEEAFDAVVGWVSANVEAVVTLAGADNPGGLSYAILLAVAAGEDPTDLGGVDLVDRLGDTLGPQGMYGGAVAGYDPSYTATFTQGLALAALAGAGEEVPDLAVGWLLDQQCDDTSPAAAVGGWEAYRADPEVPCTDPSPTTFSGADTNSTALALQGLAAVGVEPGTDPLGYLHGVQGADGGFPFLTGLDPDANSTAVVIQALVALGEDPAGEAWQVDGVSPVASLALWQVPTTCLLGDAGGLTSMWSDGFPDQVATQQGAWGLAGTPFPLAEAEFAGTDVAPSGVEAEGQPLQAAVSWHPPQDATVPVAGYDVVDADDAVVASTGPGVCSVAAIGLPAGSEQTLRVVARFVDLSESTSAPVGPIAVGGAEVTFPDVPAGAPFAAEISWAVVEGLVQGTPQGDFLPQAPVSRQAMAAFLYRFAGEPPFDLPDEPSFPDVPATNPFYDEVEWLSETGIATGDAQGDFLAQAPVSRQAMAAFLYRFAGEPPFDLPDEPSFPDVPATNPFYDEVEWLVSTGIATGYGDGEFRPAAPVARQAMTAFLYRYTTELPVCRCLGGAAP